MPRRYGRQLDKTNFKWDKLKEKTKAGRPDLVEKPRWKRSRRVAARPSCVSCVARFAQSLRERLSPRSNE
jgi:hypothetical protein